MRRAVINTVSPRITATTRQSATWSRGRRQANRSKTYTTKFVKELNAWVNQRLNEVPQTRNPAQRAAIEQEIDRRLKQICDRADRGLSAQDLMSAAKPLQNLGNPCTFRRCTTEAAKFERRHDTPAPGLVGPT